MNLTKLPIFQFADKSLMQLQTKWASILNPIVGLGNSFNTQPPQIAILTTGSGLFNVPPEAFYLDVIVVGGGGGGAGSGASGAGNGANGNDSTFGTNLLIARGGNGAAGGSGNGGTGGTATIYAGASGFFLIGSAGQGSNDNPVLNSAGVQGGNGGVGFFGAGAGAGAGQTPTVASANTGSGGGGAGIGAVNSGISGAGGGSGGFIKVLITQNIQTSYGYVIGSGGGAGIAGVSGLAGASGASGIIIIQTYFQ